MNNAHSSSEPFKVTWRKSLSAQLGRQTILMMVVVLILVGGGLIRIARQAEMESAHRLQEENAAKVSMMISGYVRGAMESLQLFENVTSLSKKTVAEQKGLLEELLMSRSSLFSQLIQVSKEGFEVIKISRFHTYLEWEMGGAADQLALAALHSGEPEMGPVYLSSESGLLSVRIAVPCRNTTKNEALMAEVNISQLWQAISQIRIGDSGYAYLVDKSGRFVAYQEFSKVLQRYGEDMLRMPPVKAYVIGGKPEYEAGEPEEYTGLNQEAVIGHYEPIPGTSWAVIVELPVKTAYAAARKMQWYLLSMTFCGVILAGLAAFMVSSRLVRPIRALTLAAQRIGAGDLGAPVVETPMKNEVDVLTRAFRRMQHELKVLYGNLERQLVDLRQAEAALWESEEGFRTLVNSSPEGILRYDLNGFLIDENRSFTQMTGYTHSELQGKHIGDLVPGEHKIRLYESIEGIKKGTHPEAPLDLELTRKNGSLMSVVMRGWLIRGEDGQPLALGAFVADITEEKRLAKEKKALEEQLLRNQKMEAIGTMAGGIAHDFNNILTGIMGYTELAVLTLGEDRPDISQHLSSSLAASNRAKELVQQLLRFSRKEASELGPTSLRLLLQEAIQLVRSTLPSTIRIEAHIGNEKNVVMADSTQLHQVIMNLCINAYHAMKAKGGTLSIELKNVRLSQPKKFFGMECPPGPYAVLMVADTGTGIAPEHLDRIFEPYFTTKKPNEGTGLGLSVTFGVIKSHGGMIEVESMPEKGTAFSIYLPLIQHAADQAKQPALSIPMGRGEQILVVDDEFFFRDVVSAMLKGLNYRVSVYERSLSALNAFTADPTGFDAVITDQTMPDMTGIELISRIRGGAQSFPLFSAPVIVTTLRKNLQHTTALPASCISRSAGKNWASRCTRP